MNLYIAVWEANWEGYNYPVGVFSTREKAHQALRDVTYKGDRGYVIPLELDERTDGLGPMSLKPVEKR